MTTHPRSPSAGDHPQISLPGQTHVAHGPHDQTGMYLMHHAFRRDLAGFEAAVRRTPVGDRDTWAALADRWALFAETLHHHHAIEDDHLWPTMLRSLDTAGDAEGRATLEAMEEEHGRIDPALRACAEGFAAMRSHPCADHRNALDVHVTETRALLADHLRHEETGALPLLQRTVTVDDYAAFEAAAEKGYPVRMVPFLVCWVMHGVPDDLAREFLGQAGTPHRLLRRLFRGRFERREQRAFRYV
ncbi:hemerythrin domain-containing protein [Nocardioides sp.]|uniref:hemerythrin domain-containing protein n=1 Tax=Nocardioides sp. TaxID=35761 RepID=UPI001A1F6121|nr:hemerythrin domain-containing protein [Nocardioides sp.]MBJ7355709.1 hemerythrin domain-containing protein [Nocardioides sp.]